MKPVLVDHDEPLLAAGVAATLAQSDDFHPVRPGAAESDEVELIVTDYESGLRWARMAQPGCAILILTRCLGEAAIRRAIEAGVLGYLLAGCTREDLLSALRDLGCGRTVLAMRVVATLAESVKHPTLTGRELGVLRHAAKGCSDKEISGRLLISVGTVKSHMKAILAKLGARGRTEAAAIARSRGLVAEEREAMVLDVRGAGRADGRGREARGL